MQKFSRSWDQIMRISYLQRRILIASIIYYEFDENIISDQQYNELSQQLVELQRDFSISKSTYGYAFKDFDGSTGFDLVYKLKDEDKEYLYSLAEMLTGRKTASQASLDVPRCKKKGRLI